MVQAAAGAGPLFSAVVTNARSMINALFAAGLITKTEQDATMAYVNGVEALVNAGITPKHWTVEPDPVV
jgi:hypothetical protein